MQMRDAIVKYFEEENIRGMDRDCLRKYFKSLIGEDAERFIKNYLKNAKFDLAQTPMFYDTFQNQTMPFEISVSFLGVMVDLIENSYCGNSKAVVLDAGCATGLEITYLAHHFRETDMKFQGLDTQPGMIMLADQRKKRRDLHNVTFYIEDLTREDPQPAQYCDLLYTKSTIEGDPRILVDSFRNICKRIKSGGTMVLGCYSKAVGESLDRLLRGDCMELVDSVLVSKEPFPHAYNSVFKVK